MGDYGPMAPVIEALEQAIASLRRRNTELTADFHRVQSELDAAEQERDELRAVLRELVEACEAHIDEFERGPDGSVNLPAFLRALDVLGDDDG